MAETIGGEGVRVPIMIVGNKCDEEQSREVKKELASKLVSEQMKDSGHMETSAKLGQNVQQAFQELLSLDKTRVMSLKLDLKKSRSQIRREKLKNKCEIM